jgi:DNA-binding FadR family transcriptional regulator
MTDPPLPRDVFAAIEPSFTYEGVVERLENAIRVGRLAPGARLPPERELAPMLGVSRWTLRKAVVTLEQTGHLVSRSGRTGGNFVADLPPVHPPGPLQLREDWREVLDLRLAIELGAVALAARRRTEVHLRRLETLQEEMRDYASFDEYRRADVAFHVMLAEAADAPRVLAAMTAIQVEASAIIACLAHPRTLLESSNDEHAALIDLLRERDVDAATRMIRRHLDGTLHITASLQVADPAASRQPGNGPSVAPSP